MAKFVVEKYTLVSSGRAEYRGVKVNNAYWFESNSTDEAIEKLHSVMSQGTYILKIQSENGYTPFYKATMNTDKSIKVNKDTRQK